MIPKTMRAMVLERPGRPLELRELPLPVQGPGQLLVRVQACGVCRTDLHIVDGELPPHRLPLVPGHQVVGTVVRAGPGAGGRREGDRVGIPWLAWTDGICRFCQGGQENLCERALFTGYDLDGGFAEYTTAAAAFCLPLRGGALPGDPLPPAAGLSDLQTAPLLCAGLIGYRALRLAGGGERLGLYGFGSSAHIVLQVAKHQGRAVYAFTRPGDAAGQAFARGLGADWAGDSDRRPPEELDAALIFAPAGGLVPYALRAVRRGGTVVCAGIHMSDIPSFPYRDLWGERVLRSVANLTRQDGEEFLALAPRVPVRVEVHPWPLEQANEALEAIRSGKAEGSTVLSISAPG